MNIDRRKVIKTAIFTSVAVPSVMLFGCAEAEPVDRKLKFTSLSEAFKEAEKLVSRNIIMPETGFSLPQTLIHCAQSIEYSMSGFPESKSSLFQNTLGSAAFSVFLWRGRMSHNLTEEIPGAPIITSDVDATAALERLHSSIQLFHDSNEPLQPHFAYGQLNRSDYELAHALHLADHFSSIDA